MHHIVDLVTEAPTGFSHSSAITDLVDLAARAADEPVLNDKNSTGKAAAGIVVLQPVADIPVGAARAG